jgi:hypothetical protein
MEEESSAVLSAECFRNEFCEGAQVGSAAAAGEEVIALQKLNKYSGH